MMKFDKNKNGIGVLFTPQDSLLTCPMWRAYVGLLSSSRQVALYTLH